MNAKKTLLIGAALAGLTVGGAAFADDRADCEGKKDKSSMSKNSCKGMASCKGKASCKSTKEKGENNSCKGKAECSGKKGN